jgi:hypothetical protein
VSSVVSSLATPGQQFFRVVVIEPPTSSRPNVLQ